MMSIAGFIFHPVQILHLMKTRAFLIDLDGVLYVGKTPVAGARECLELMDDLGYDYRFVSNSTRRCRRSIAERLNGWGYDISPDRIFTPPLAAVEYMKMSNRKRCFLMTTADVQADFEAAGVTLTDRNADFVVVGDAGDAFTYDRLNTALRLILDGAMILALERDRYWMGSDGLVLSTGPFVAALEYATGRRSVLMGKPSPEFFGLALLDMGVRPQEATMIGDDILTDVGGAKKAGMKGILVKTGKYREDAVRGSGIVPDLVLDSIAGLIEYL
jgi:HAD superfamily hydrolase (TIGR01458 family)